MIDDTPGIKMTEDGTMLVDLNEAPDSSFEVLPRGTYDVTVDSVEFGTSSSGNPMWTWVLEVNDGEFAGHKLFFHTVFAGKGLARTKKVLSAIAPELFQGPFDPSDPEVTGSLVGKQARARVDVRKYEGEDRNNVRDILPASNAESMF